MKKDIALLLVIILAAAAVIKGVDIQSVDEYYSLHSDDTANAAHTVTLTVDCSDILDNYDMLDKNLRDERYIDFLRKQKRQQHVSLTFSEDEDEGKELSVPDPEPLPEERVIFNEQQEAIRNGMWSWDYVCSN